MRTLKNVARVHTKTIQSLRTDSLLSYVYVYVYVISIEKGLILWLWLHPYQPTTAIRAREPRQPRVSIASKSHPSRTADFASTLACLQRDTTGFWVPAPNACHVPSSLRSYSHLCCPGCHTTTTPIDPNDRSADPTVVALAFGVAPVPPVGSPSRHLSSQRVQ